MTANRKNSLEFADTTFEKFPLKNIFKRHIHRVLSFNFFSRQLQRRSMRHAFWSSCVAEDSHISSWRACLFGALDSARICIFLPAGRRSSGSPWIVHRGSVGRKNSVNRSYINYVYVAPTLLRDAHLVPDSHLNFGDRKVYIWEVKRELKFLYTRSLNKKKKKKMKKMWKNQQSVRH